MSPIIVAALVFFCAFGGSLAGMWLRHALPDHHLQNDAKDTVKVGVGLVATMTALLLSFVISSANDTFKDMDAEVKTMALDIASLDRMLARYGAETKEVREMLYRALQYRLETTWPEGSAQADTADTRELLNRAEKMGAIIRHLPAVTDDQRWFKSHAMDLGEEILEQRFMIFSKVYASIPVPFLVVLIFWITIIFTSFGMFAPQNKTVIITLFICSLCISSALFLVVELEGPLDGIIKVSPDPLRYVFARINQ